MKKIFLVLFVCLFICIPTFVFGNSFIYNSMDNSIEFQLLKLYYCNHPFSNIYQIEPPTCNEQGEGLKVCSICGCILRINSIIIDKLGCNYNDWFISKKATPLSEGVKTRNCLRCGKEETQSYIFNTIGKDYIYIPTVNIHSKLYVGALTQSNIDIYDLVYDTDYYGVKGVWVLGHQYGTLKDLYKVKVGDVIYIGVNNISKGYVVRYSEFALQNERKTDIIGQTSNISVLSNLEGETLHIYTCYGKEKNHRWMVLAELVED